MAEPIGFITPIQRIGSVERLTPEVKTETVSKTYTPSFIDVFTKIYETAESTQAQKSQDMIDVMLGEIDNIDEITANITKAEIATELLINVKNTVVDAYNEIIKMQI